jgi:hypothetical protein
MVWALVAVLLVTRDSGVDGPPGAGTSSDPPPRTPTAGDLRGIESDLVSKHLPTVRKVFAIPGDVELTPEFARAVRQWSTVTIEQGTYAPTSSTSGEVEAVLQTKAGSTRWILRLDLVGDEWLIAGTRESS